MRKFSNSEQAVIRRLVSHAKTSLSYVLINVYNDVFFQRKVEYKNGQLVFYREIDTIHDVDDFLSIEKEIIDTSFLIAYLKENRYIYLIDDNSIGDGLKEVGGFIKEGLTPISKDLDKRVCAILDEAMNHRVFVSTDLIQLVDDNFKTLEEQALEESRKQTEYSRKSFVVAMIALAISVLIPLLTALFSKNEVVLNESQFERLISESGNKDDVEYIEQNDSNTIRLDTVSLDSSSIIKK